MLQYPGTKYVLEGVDMQYEMDLKGFAGMPPPAAATATGFRGNRQTEYANTDTAWRVPVARPSAVAAPEPEPKLARGGSAFRHRPPTARELRAVVLV